MKKFLVDKIKDDPNIVVGFYTGFKHHDILFAVF